MSSILDTIDNLGNKFQQQLENLSEVPVMKKHGGKFLSLGVAIMLFVQFNNNSGGENADKSLESTNKIVKPIQEVTEHKANTAELAMTNLK